MEISTTVENQTDLPFKVQLYTLGGNLLVELNSTDTVNHATQCALQLIKEQSHEIRDEIVDVNLIKPHTSEPLQELYENRLMLLQDYAPIQTIQVIPRRMNLTLAIVFKGLDADYQTCNLWLSTFYGSNLPVTTDMALEDAMDEWAATDNIGERLDDFFGNIMWNVIESIDFHNTGLYIWTRGKCIPLLDHSNNCRLVEFTPYWFTNIVIVYEACRPNRYLVQIDDIEQFAEHVFGINPNRIHLDTQVNPLGSNLEWVAAFNRHINIHGFPFDY